MTRFTSLAVATLLLLLGTGIDPWQSLYRENRKGSEAFERGELEAALKHYTEAQALAPDDPRVLYNLGLALARLGRSEEAEKAWTRASQLAEGDLRRDAWYNRGVAAFEAQDAQRAAEAFTEALLEDPTDADARHNLELALRQLQAQPPQPQQQQQQQQQQKDDSEQKQQQQSQQQDQQQQNQQQDPQQQNQQQQNQQQERNQQQSGDDPNEEKERQQPPKRSPSDEKNPPEQNKGEDQRQGQSMEQAGSEGEKDAKDGDREWAEKLLEYLEKNESDALRRAMRAKQAEKKGQSRDRKKGKDW